MTLTGKIKQALHLDKDKAGAGDDAAGGAGGAEYAAEPQTGPAAYQPLTSSAEAGSGTTGSSAKAASGLQGSRGDAGDTEYAEGVQGDESGLTGKSGAGSSSLSSQAGAASGQQGIAGDSGGFSNFKQGYSAGEPGYASGYKAGDPLYKESVRRDKDGSYSAELSAEANNKHWAQARELTLAAEREVATATLSGQKASKELAAAEKAEKAVRQAQIKHREALEEAEKYQRIIADSNLKEQDLADAQELFQARRNAASQAENDLRIAESDLTAKKRELEGLTPKVDQYGERLPALEEELAARQRDRAAAEDERSKLLAAAKDAEATCHAHAGDMDALERELEAAEQAAAIKQQEYIDARNAAQNTAQRLADLRSRLRGLDDELLGNRNRVQQAEENLPAYQEAENRAARELENAQAEWYRLKELEEEYGRNYTSAHDHYKGLHGKYGPTSKELQDSHSLLKAREDDLGRARSRSQSAEKKYRELLALADRHKKYGDSAAEAATAHGQKYEALKREAAIHGDKHVEYWNAARQHGETGSTESSNLIKKLEEKVKELSAKNEP